MEKQRNHGIDLLRIISMFFVIVLHSIGKGGLLSNVVIGTDQYKAVWLLEILAYCAVNIFAIISGYVSYNDNKKKIKCSNYINIWMQAVFYGLLITLLFNIKFPSRITKRDYIIVFFPLLNDLYWYFTAYTGLFFLMPFINNAIRNCSNETLKKIFIVIIILFSVIETPTKIFELNNGYSFTWIIILYILGAIIKKCKIGEKLKFKQSIISIILLYTITYLYKMYGVELQIFNFKITKNIFINYTSPTMVGIAMLYVIIFSKIKINKIIKKITIIAAPSTFSIYLLNNHRLIWTYVMNNLFAKMHNQTILTISLYVIAFSISFVILAITLDKFRILIFKICKVKKIELITDKLLNQFIKKLMTVI